jgi:hypothetical protein
VNTRLIAFVAAVGGMLVSARVSIAGTVPYEIDADDTCYVGSVPEATLHCTLQNPNGAYFTVNSVPLPTNRTYFTQLPNRDERALFTAPFDSVLLYNGANTFTTAIFSTGDDAGDYVDAKIDLVSPSSRLNLWSIQLRGQPYSGSRTVSLSLSQIDPQLAQKLASLQSAIDAAFDAVIRDAATIQNLDAKMQQLSDLQDDLDALVDAGIDAITQEALDGLLAKYSSLEPGLLDPLRSLAQELQMDIGALQGEVQRIESEFQQQLSDLDHQLGVQSPPGVDLHAPGTYSPGVGPSTIPPINLPPVTGPDDWDPSHDPFAAVADDTIARLQATLNDGTVADRDGFYNVYVEWTDNQKALSTWITPRAPYHRKEYAAYIAAQQRVVGFVTPFVDAQGWLLDAPIPQDVKNLVEGLKRLKMEMQARNLKRALNQWDPQTPNDERELVLDTLRAAAGGVMSLDDNDVDPSQFPNVFKMFTDLMDSVAVAVKDAVHFAISLTRIGDVIALCEATTGWRNCVRGGVPMTVGEQVLSGFSVLAGTETFWRYAGAVVKVPASKVSALIEKLLAKLADRKRLRALLLVVEKDADKLADLLQLFDATELESVVAAVGSDEFKVVIKDLEAQDLRLFVDKLDKAKLAELAGKFDGTVWKHYGADFFAAFKGITNDTKQHLLVGEGIAKGQIGGLHDKAKFLDLLVAQGNGQVMKTTVNGTNAKIVKYEYKLYRRSPTGGVAQPPVLQSGDNQIKTVIEDLANDWNKWQKSAEEAIDDAMRKKTFPSSTAADAAWSGVSSDGTAMTGYFRDDQIATFYPDM